MDDKASYPYLKLGYLQIHTDVRLWTNGIVPYKFSSSIQAHGQGGRHSIREAMDHWEDRTCLRFTLRNHERDYVEYINTGSACYSAVGKSGQRQTINMASGRGCGIGTIVHEIGHAIGFWHEQSRPDRDNTERICRASPLIPWCSVDVKIDSFCHAA